ncbi:MAG TPA: hypothetical protein VFX89_01265 [Gammaproteobacteria bacterium]|nr:hypothetical protein [Gammaproteobacteria bacterium]
MKAVARLLFVYITGTLWMRAMSALGLTAIVIGTGILAYLPPLVAQHGGPAQFSLAVETMLSLLPVVGIVALMLGGSLMPTMVSRLAASHYSHVLPHARGKLLASAFGSVVIIAVVASAALWINIPAQMRIIISFERLLAGSLLTYSSVYLALWIASRLRSSLALIVGTFMVLAALVLPLRFMGLMVPLRWALVPFAILWSVVAAALLFAPHIRRSAVGLRTRLQRGTSGAFASTYDGGDEVDLMLGTARPWLIALAQIVPIVLAGYLLGWLFGDARLDRKIKLWLGYLTMLTMLSAAATTFAAARSRALWLRAHWTREQLFARIEAAYWKRTCYVLGVLLVAMALVGTYFGLPTRPLAFGLALLVLTATVSTYLGLVITRSLGWAVTALALGGILALLATAWYVADTATPTSTIVSLEAGLAALAVALRSVAKRRWLGLDWMLSRPETATRAAA